MHMLQKEAVESRASMLYRVREIFAGCSQQYKKITRFAFTGNMKILALCACKFHLLLTYKRFNTFPTYSRIFPWFFLDLSRIFPASFPDFSLIFPACGRIPAVRFQTAGLFQYAENLFHSSFIFIIFVGKFLKFIEIFCNMQKTFSLCFEHQ